MANIEFSKPFQFVSLIEFKYDTPVSISLVNIIGAFPSINGSMQLSRVHGVQAVGSLPNSNGSMQLSRVHGVQAVGMLNDPLGTIYVIYDNNVWRGLQAVVDSNYNETIPLETNTIESNWNTTNKLDVSNKASWKDSIAAMASVGISSQQAIPIDGKFQASFRDSKPVYSSVFSSFDVMLKCDTTNVLKWSQGKVTNNSVSSSSDQCIAVDRDYKTTWSNSVPVNRSWDSSCDAALPLNKTFVVPFDSAKRRPGASWCRPVITPVEPIPIYSADIVFGDVLFEYTTNIIFGHKTILNKILSKRLYYMLHNFYLRRVADNAEIQINRIDATCSMTDYTFGFSFNVIGKDSYNKLVEYAPMELELQVNRMEMAIHSN